MCSERPSRAGFGARAASSAVSCLGRQGGMVIVCLFYEAHPSNPLARRAKNAATKTKKTKKRATILPTQKLMLEAGRRRSCCTRGSYRGVQQRFIIFHFPDQHYLFIQFSIKPLAQRKKLYNKKVFFYYTFAYWGLVYCRCYIWCHRSTTAASVSIW